MHNRATTPTHIFHSDGQQKHWTYADTMSFLRVDSTFLSDQSMCPCIVHYAMTRRGPCMPANVPIKQQHCMLSYFPGLTFFTALLACLSFRADVRPFRFLQYRIYLRYLAKNRLRTYLPPVLGEAPQYDNRVFSNLGEIVIPESMQPLRKYGRTNDQSVVLLSALTRLC